MKKQIILCGLLFVCACGEHAANKQAEPSSVDLKKQTQSQQSNNVDSATVVPSQNTAVESLPGDNGKSGAYDNLKFLSDIEMLGKPVLNKIDSNYKSDLLARKDAIDRITNSEFANAQETFNVLYLGAGMFERENELPARLLYLNGLSKLNTLNEKIIDLLVDLIRERETENESNKNLKAFSRVGALSILKKHKDLLKNKKINFEIGNFVSDLATGKLNNRLDSYIFNILTNDFKNLIINFVYNSKGNPEKAIHVLFKLGNVSDLEELFNKFTSKNPKEIKARDLDAICSLSKVTKKDFNGNGLKKYQREYYTKHCKKY